jgi:hypothetical protein
MRICIFPHNNEHFLLKSYLDSRNVRYEDYDEWDFSAGSRFIVPQEECLLILPYTILRNLNTATFIKDVNSSKCYIYFIEQHDNMNVYREVEQQISQITRPVHLHADAKLHDEGIPIATLSYDFTDVLNNFYLETNQNRTKDFLLTTILKPKRLHRKILIDKLKQADLLKNYAGVIHSVESAADLFVGQQKYGKWLGTLTSAGPHKWLDGKIYWDLYNTVHYELVPETRHDYASYPTEKIWKPIVAKIPFICLSDYRFYNTLHSLGFKTFDGIIDESFASEPDLETRVDKIIQTMSNINAQEFYERSRDICEHNYRTLCHFYFENTNRFIRQLDELFKPMELTQIE